MRPDAASTTSGRHSIVPRVLFSARPPWFETMTPSTPFSTARRVSSPVTMPLMSTFIVVVSWSFFTKSQSRLSS